MVACWRCGADISARRQHRGSIVEAAPRSEAVGCAGTSRTDTRTRGGGEAPPRAQYADREARLRQLVKDGVSGSWWTESHLPTVVGNRGDPSNKCSLFERHICSVFNRHRQWSLARSAWLRRLVARRCLSSRSDGGRHVEPVLIFGPVVTAAREPPGATRRRLELTEVQPPDLVRSSRLLCERGLPALGKLAAFPLALVRQDQPAIPQRRSTVASDTTCPS